MTTEQRIKELEEIIKKNQHDLRVSQAEGKDIDPDDIKPTTACGTCRLSWNDDLSSTWTPVPSARCPFEYIHEEVKELRKLKRSIEQEDEGQKTIIQCPAYDIVVALYGWDDDNDCYETGMLLSVDPSLGLTDDPQPSDPFLVATEAMVRLIVAQAVEGIDITTPAYGSAVETVVDALGNRYGD